MIIKKGLYNMLYPVYVKIRNAYYGISGSPQAIGFIFMLHRVEKQSKEMLHTNQNMNISPAYLDQFLCYVKERYDIIRMEEVPDRISSKQKHRFAVFTMDDGYKDNLYNALPIFKKHNVPYTIFITTSFPDRNAILWWYELEDLILSHNSIELSNGLRFNASTKEEKESCFMGVRREILKLDQHNIEPELNNLFSNYTIDWFSKCKELCLSWEELEILKNEPLVTLGSHTQHHYNLKQLETEMDVQIEVANGFKRLIEKGAIRTNVFAYPFGSYNEASCREFKVLSSMSDKFILGVRAMGGPVSVATNDMYALPRIMLEENKSFRDLILVKGTHV